MECPNCKHRTSPDSKITCSHCHQEFPRDYLEEYEKLQYLSQWLEQHRSQLGDNAGLLVAEVDSHSQQLGNRLGLRQVSIPPTTAQAARGLTPEPQSIAVPVPAMLGAVPQTVVQPKPVSKPAAPPRPPRPPFNWNKLWDNAVNFVVSGALLRALLYMGAFMIVVSAFVLVINFWNIFPPVLQVVFIFALPSAFYLGGWLIRTRLKLAQAGMVITGIGAVLLAVDFAALYQLANLAVDINLYWLFAALITTAVYFFTAYRLQGEFFDYLMLLGGVNTLLALTRVLHTSLEWTIAVVPLACLLMISLAVLPAKQGDFWHDTSRAARYLSQVLTPISLTAILFVPAPGSEAGKTTAFLCAGLVYGLLAWKFPSGLQLGLMLLYLTVATGFGVQIFRPGGTWLPSAGAVLSAGYILTGWKYFGKESQFKQRVSYRQIIMVGGFMLAFASLVYSLVLLNLGKEMEAAIPLSLLALSFCAWNLLLREPLNGYFGTFLMLLPFGLWLDLAHLQVDFFPLAYLLLISGLYLPGAILIRRIESKLAAPFQWLGWVTSILVLCTAFSMALVPSIWGDSLLTWVPALTLSLLTLYYVFNAWYFRMPVFAWATAIVFPIAAADWMGVRELSSEQIALVWACLPFLYLLVERSLNHQKQSIRYRLPFGLGVIALALVGLALALINYGVEAQHGGPVTLVAIGMPVLLAILAARLYHNRWILFFEAGLSALWAMLFMQVYAPNLLGKELTASQYGLVLCAVAWVHLLIAAALDRLQTRYSHGLYLGGYGLAVLAIGLSISDLPILLWTLGSFLLVTSASAVLAYFNQHHSFEDFVNFIEQKDTLIRRVVRLSFLFAAVYALPAWIIFFETYLVVPTAWQGFSLVVLAPVYIGVGLFQGRCNRDYNWPFYSAGYILTFAGALMALGSEPAIIYALALDAAIYAASAFIFRQPLWLYLATFLTPVTLGLTLDYTHALTAAWIGWSFTGLAFLYFGLGQLLERYNVRDARHVGFALPLYIPGYLLSALALVAVSGERMLTLGVYPANMLLYALSAWRFRRTIFIYPAVWLSLIPYHNLVGQFLHIAPEWLNLAWLPLILVLIGLGRFVFHKSPLEMSTPQAVFKSLSHPAVPFYILAYALSVAMLFDSNFSPFSRTWMYAIVSVLYLGSALLFRHPVWLYPTLVTTHLTILAYFSIHPTDSPARYISLPFLVLTWLEALAGYLVSLRFKITETTASEETVFNSFGRKLNFGELRSIGYLTVPSWAQPIFLTVTVDIIAWEALALTGTDTGVWVSAGFCLLLALFTMLWQDQLLAFLAVGLGVVAAGYELHLLGWTSLQIFAGLGGLALGLYLLSWLVERLKGVLSIWRNPLLNIALGLSIACVIITSPTAFSETISTAFALGFAGTIYLTMSLRQRFYPPGYLGMGMLIACWSLLLFVRNVAEPQFYAIPAGLYFTGMGFFEARRKPGRFAMLIEGLGLAVLLVTSFNQSLNGEAGFPYFLLLLVEALLVIWWGAARHVRVPFVIGLVASVCNILAQIVVLVNVHKPNPWIIVFGVGIGLISLGIFVERRREILLTQAKEFRLMLDKWN